MVTRLLLGGGVLLISWGVAVADSIKIDGMIYTDVLVRKGPSSNYYVQFPEDGTTRFVPKSDVDPADVVTSPDAAKREALLEQWKQNNASRERPAGAAKDARPAMPPPRPGALTPPPPSAGEARPAMPPPPPLPVRKAPDVSSTPAASAPRAKTDGPIERISSVDEKGVKQVILRGNREKEEGFENHAQELRAQQRAEAVRARQAELDAQARADQAAYEQAMRQQAAEEKRQQQLMYPQPYVGVPNAATGLTPAPATTPPATPAQPGGTTAGGSVTVR